MAKAGLELNRAVFLLVILLGSCTVKADILDDLGGINSIMFGVAAGIAALMIAVQAVKWKAAESKIERDQAKRGIINVVLGLILVLIAAGLVSVFYGTTVNNLRPPQIDCKGLDGWYSTSFGPRCVGSQLCDDWVESEYRAYYAKPPGCSFTETQKNSSCKTTPHDCPAGLFCVHDSCVSGTTTSTSGVTTTTTAKKTVACQTSLDCYDKLGICWVCPPGGGECLTIERNANFCPDCHQFPSGFTCFHGRNGYGPYCCYRVGDAVDNPSCKDGTAVGACSAKFKGLRCSGHPNELYPDPSCGGINCVDSDGGKIYTKAGTCSDVIKYYSSIINYNNYRDMCLQHQIVETYCSANRCTQEKVNCPTGTRCIVNGACV